MNAKNLIAAALLLFVAVSVAVLVGREMRQETAGEPIAAAEQLPANALVVYYLHGETRCPTCRNIEKYSREAIQAAFAEQLAEEAVVWKVVNYDQPENSHVATDYEVLAPSVVLVRTSDGKVADWRNLRRVWGLVSDRHAFTEYVQNETRAMLGS